MIAPLLILLAALASVDAEPTVIDIPLTYMKRPERMTSYLPTGVLRPALEAECPEGSWKLPELKAETPLFAAARLGDRLTLFVLDRKDGGDGLFDRIYFDANGNQDLTDDPVIEGTTRSSGSASSPVHLAEFPVVDTSIPVDGRTAPYSFQIRMYRRTYPASAEGDPTKDLIRSITFYIMNGCVYTGEFNLEGKTYRVTLGDNNANGRFGELYRSPDPSQPAVQNDSFFLTWEGTAAFQDGLEVGKYLHLEGRLYEAGIHIGEDKMTLTPVTGKLADLDLSMDTERAMLASGNGPGGIMLIRPGKRIAVPEGEYRLVSYQAFRKDDGDNLWRLKALAPPDSPLVAASGTRPALLRFGEPFHPSITVAPLRTASADGREESQARLSLQVLGAAGERLTDLRSLTNNESSIERSARTAMRPREAAYRIMDPGGRLIVEGEFTYG